jgi:hypothetical protein
MDVLDRLPNTPARSATPDAAFVLCPNRGVADLNRLSAIINQQWMGGACSPGAFVEPSLTDLITAEMLRR